MELPVDSTLSTVGGTLRSKERSLLDTQESPEERHQEEADHRDALQDDLAAVARIKAELARILAPCRDHHSGNVDIRKGLGFLGVIHSVALVGVPSVFPADRATCSKEVLELASRRSDERAFVEYARGLLIRLRTKNATRLEEAGKACHRFMQQLESALAQQSSVCEEERQKLHELRDTLTQLTGLRDEVEKLAETARTLGEEVTQHDRQAAEIFGREAPWYIALNPLWRIADMVLAPRSSNELTDVDCPTIQQKAKEIEAQCDTIVTSLTHTHGDINGLRATLRQLDGALGSISSVVISAGRLLTDAKNVSSKLQVLAADLGFLENSVDIVAEVPRDFSIDNCISEFQLLLDEYPTMTE